MAGSRCKYLVFDTETVADGDLVCQIQYPGDRLTPQAAVARFRAERLEETGSTFIPYTYQIPVSVVVGKVTSDFQLVDIVALDEPEFRPHVITRHFWTGWEKYGQPTLVTFNGRGFDVPVLELAAFRYGVSLEKWIGPRARSYDQPRYRYNTAAHLDLLELLSNHGATRFAGGLNLAAHLLGKPGKLDTQGEDVQSLYEAGRCDEINDYCRCDVLDTYFVFLRSQVLLGNLEPNDEQEIVAATKSWLEDLAETSAGLQKYLAHWGDWVNPW